MIQDYQQPLAVRNVREVWEASFDLINDGVSRQQQKIRQIIVDIGPLRLSYDSIPVDF